jgi:hypothetical protein
MVVAVTLESGPAAELETPIGQRWISAVRKALAIDTGGKGYSESTIGPVGAIPGRLGAPRQPHGFPVDSTSNHSNVDAINDYLRVAGDDLRERRRECFARGRQTFLIMITLAITSLVVFSVTALVTGLSLSAGTIAPSCISALLAAATAPTWKLYQAENARAAQFDRDLVRLEEIRIARAFGSEKAIRSSLNITVGPIKENPKKSSRKNEKE